MYGFVRLVLIGAGVMLGLIIAGDGHQVASIIAPIGHTVSHHPLLTVGVIVGIVIGFLLGGERAVYRIGEYEKQKLRHAIDVGGRPLSK